MELINENLEGGDYLLFGGESYREPTIAEGPFVMNLQLEIADAYKDFYNGKYGLIDYQKQKARVKYA